MASQSPGAPDRLVWPPESLFCLLAFFKQPGQQAWEGLSTGSRDKVPHICSRLLWLTHVTEAFLALSEPVCHL